MKVCPYGHDQKTQSEYKAGKIQGYNPERLSKTVEKMKAQGTTQFGLPEPLRLSP